MIENTNDSANPVLTFEGKKYLINVLSNEIKESIKVLQITETQLKMQKDSFKSFFQLAKIIYLIN